LPRGSRLVVSCLCLAALFAAGCGKKGPDVVPVTGRITKGGKPVSFLTVTFWPELGRASMARTDADGRYELEFSKDIPMGAVPGRHTVFFRASQERIDEPLNLKDKKYHPQTPQILKKFNAQETSPCKVEVKHETPEVNIELNDFDEEPAARR
jgi:hypothetical protein